MIPIERIIDKLEYHFGQEDLTSARSLLEYWRAEAQTTGDEQGLIEMLNEQLGLYRRLDDQAASDEVVGTLVPILRSGNWLETLSGATMLLNVATNHCHFGHPEEALPLYPEVAAAFDALLPPYDYRRAGLANNRAACLRALHDYDGAAELYTQALDQLSHLEGHQAEQAVSLVNRATAHYQDSPLDPHVDEDMQAAYAVLTGPIPQDSNYVFVLGKLIPIFEHLGYERECTDLKERKAQAQSALR